MKRFHVVTEMSNPAPDKRYSPTLERFGKYLFWLLVAAVLVARVAYYPATHPAASEQLSDATTDIVR
jgi:hypothetical protein